MYSMSAASDGDEQLSYEPQHPNQEDVWQLWIKLLRAGVAVYLITSISIRLWEDDEIRLHVLNAAIRVLQSVARIIGGWALVTEKTYNAYVETLH